MGCGINKETGDEIIFCSGFSDNKMKKENISIKSYGKVSEISGVAKSDDEKVKS